MGTADKILVLADPDRQVRLCESSERSQTAESRLLCTALTFSQGMPTCLLPVLQN